MIKELSEDNTKTNTEIEDTFHTNYFPNYLYYFQILYRLDKENASIILFNTKHYIERTELCKFSYIYNSIIAFIDSIKFSYF